MIEKNVPMPQEADRAGKSVFTGMEVGDSIFYEEGKLADRGRTAFRVYCHRNKWKGCFRRVDGGIRIWRIS